ncbi:MAG: hypothetical protein M1838_003564 [Thelocarpon superellum]|nr:MAG: hypothetical protein M1838_003564 [Thelocarpon superellum]
MSQPLKEKLAIVTGSSRGIGAGVARNLARKGCSLVLNYASDASTRDAEALASELRASHDVRVHPVQADLGDPAGAGTLVSGAKEHFADPKTGAFRVDILVNNAGVGGGSKVGEVTPEAFYRMYNINVLGPLLLVGEVLPYLPHDRSGRIVNVSSIAATAGMSGHSVYGGTKAALDGMTRTWARELAERATVNSVNPGPVATAMMDRAPDALMAALRPWTVLTPLMAVREDLDSKELLKKADVLGGRPAHVDDIAGVVGMLCGAESAWCTGSVICANGGFRFGL